MASYLTGQQQKKKKERNGKRPEAFCCQPIKQVNTLQSSSSSFLFLIF
jgi:hypothetical protein